MPFFSESEPEQIRENSETIKSILSYDDFDAQGLVDAVEQREKMILKLINDDEDLDRSLLQDLSRTNQELTELVNSLRSDQQKVLVKFLRTRKAVKKYQ